MKTEKQIESDVFDIIKESDLAIAVSGFVYRKGMRPDNPELEDIVVKFLSGYDEQIQSGIVVVNIYVPDVQYQGYSAKSENIDRVGKLQKLVNEIFDDFSNVEYLIEKDGTPTSLQADGIEQHFIYVRLKYKRLSNN